VKVDKLEIYSGKLHFRKHLNLERIDSKNTRKGTREKKARKKKDKLVVPFSPLLARVMVTKLIRV